LRNTIYPREMPLMLEESSLVAFTATRNADRALQFYRDVLGLHLVEDGPFALVKRGRRTRLERDRHPAHH